MFNVQVSFPFNLFYQLHSILKKLSSILLPFVPRFTHVKEPHWPWWYRYCDQRWRISVKSLDRGYKSSKSQVLPS